MKQTRVPLIVTWLLSAIWILAAPVCARALDQPLPQTLPASVDRVLPSKPEDLLVLLKNGLTVLIREDSTNPVVSTQVYVRAGSLYEGRRMGAGLSHYLEHVVSGGTTRSFTEEQARIRLERLGGASNAYTSYDRTVYYINTDAGHWQDALDLLLSYVTECALAAPEVTREKPIIQQEFKLGENNPRRRLWELFLQTAYRVSPVRNPVIGYEPIFVRQDRDSLVHYYQERYQPQNMIVTVVGRVHAADVLKFVTERMGSVQRADVTPVVWPAEPLQINPRQAEVTLPIARLTRAIVGFPSVSLADPDLYPLDVLAILLGEGRTSRLYQRLKEHDKLVLSVSAYNWTPAFVHGQFIVSLSLAPHQWSRTLAALADELELFKQTGSSPAELEKAKKQVIAQHIFDKQTASEVASSLASSYFDTADPYFDEAYVEGVRRVTREDVLRVAEKYLVAGRLNVVAIQPPATSPAVPTEKTATESRQEPGPVQEVTLKNGLRVLLKEDHRLPVATVQLYGLGGLLLEQDRPPGLAAFTAALLTAGTKSRTKRDLAASLEDVGGRIRSGSGNNTYYVSAKVLREDLDLALDVLADIVLHSSFPEMEIEKRRRETLLAIERQDEDWQHEVLRMFKAGFYQDHPYGHDELGTRKSVTAFTRQTVLDCYRAMVRPQHTVLAVYGDFDAAEVAQRITELLGPWSSDAAQTPEWPDETAPLQSDRVVEKKNNKTSAALFLGTNGMALDDSLRPALDVLDALLSGIGYPSGRLQEALRGGTSNLVYVVHAFPFYGIRAGYFGILTQTTMNNLDQVQKIVTDSLKRLKNEPVSSEELETAKDMVLTMHNLSLESLDAQAQRAAVNEVLGLGRQYDQKYPELVRKVSLADIRRVAQKLFSHTLLVRTLPEHPVEVLQTPPPRPDYQ